MPGRTTKSATRAPAPAGSTAPSDALPPADALPAEVLPGPPSPADPSLLAPLPADDDLKEPEEELAEDHVVRRFFATHERDFRPGPRRHHAHDGLEPRPAPRPGARRRRASHTPDDEG